jgi:hypothetical protein
MEAGDAHKVGVYQVNKQESGSGQIPGAAGSGKMFGVYLRGKTVEPPHAFKEIPDRFQGLPAVPFQEEAQHTHPESDKIQVYRDLPGSKGYVYVQGMIHLGHRDAARKQGGFILKKEEVVYDGTNTAKGGPAEESGPHYLQYCPRQGSLPYRALCAAMNHEKLLSMIIVSFRQNIQSAGFFPALNKAVPLTGSDAPVWGGALHGEVRLP